MVGYFQQFGHGCFRPQGQDLVQHGIVDEIVALVELLEYGVGEGGVGCQEEGD